MKNKIKGWGIFQMEENQGTQLNATREAYLDTRLQKAVKHILGSLSTTCIR